MIINAHWSACKLRYSFFFFFDVLLTVHLSIFISVINHLDAQNLHMVLETCRGMK